MKCIALDAMGVIFQAEDDVTELLIPFIIENGGENNSAIIESAYIAASLGEISAAEFWRAAKLSSKLEDEYLSRHRLMPGVIEFLDIAKQRDIPVWCLSNDVGRWSEKLRACHGIESRLAGSIISGDIGIRKPDRGIYERLLQKSHSNPDQLVFFDDREKNVQAANALGIKAIHFSSRTGFSEATENVFDDTH